MPDRQTIDNIFGAFVSQGTLEEAASWMASLAHAYPELNEEFVSALRGGLAEAEQGASSVVEAVNQSGYRVSTAAEAGEYCAELMSLYQRAFDAQR